MSLGQKIKISNILLSTGCLLTGSLIYVLFRPSSLLMFHWANSLGLSHEVSYMRSMAAAWYVYMPEWVIYSLPFAFWLLAYLLFVNAVWAGTYSIERHIWFWSVPLISACSEVAQLLRILPGHFCKTDMITLFIALLLGLVSSYSMRHKKGGYRCEEEYAQKYHMP